MGAKYKRNDRVAWTLVDGEVIIIAPDNSMHNLNETATFLWTRAETARTPAEFADLLAAEFEVSREQAGADAHAFVQRMASLNLLVVEG